MHLKVKCVLKKTLLKILNKQIRDAPGKRPLFFKSGSGFTIPEVLAVLLIIGIIAAVAISRYWDTNTDDPAAANALKAHLRYAQLRAMGDTVTWGIEINGSSYTLQRNKTTAPVNLPGENNATKTLQNTSVTPADTIIFSKGMGIPVDSSDNTLESDLVFSVGSETITITEFTGFIP